MKLIEKWYQKVFAICTTKTPDEKVNSTKLLNLGWITQKSKFYDEKYEKKWWRMKIFPVYLCCIVSVLINIETFMLYKFVCKIFCKICRVFFNLYTRLGPLLQRKCDIRNSSMTDNLKGSLAIGKPLTFST